MWAGTWGIIRAIKLLDIVVTLRKQTVHETSDGYTLSKSAKGT
jgi:hypothetical protein